MLAGKKFFILTFGCQMNKNDSERIAGLLSSLGWAEAAKPEVADLLVMNTCSVRQSAEDRVFGILENWRAWKEKSPEKIIALTGCMAGRDKDGKLKKKLRGVDLFFKIDELPRLGEWLGGEGAGVCPPLTKGSPPAGEAGIKEGFAGDYLSLAPLRQNKFQGFVTIQSGCDNFCSYCVVPFARGRERCRPVKDILAEARDFVANGGLEITLLGQTVNHFIAPDVSEFSKENPFKDAFAALLWELNQIKGLERIHFTAPDPRYFSDEQIEALKLPKQVNYLHLPVQSGDNEILKKMNRKYTAEEYIELIKKIRLAKPNIALGADIIVGFCGETEEQFQNTMRLYEECDFDIAYIAMYSERSGTVAAKAFKDDVPRAIKKQRWDELQALIEKNALRKNQKYVEQEVEALVEKCGSVILSPERAKDPLCLSQGILRSSRCPSGLPQNDIIGVCSGNSREMKLVQFSGSPDLLRKIIRVKIKEAKEWVLLGEKI